MGQASSSAASGLETIGGNVYVNRPNSLSWLIIGLAVVVAGIVLIKWRKK